MDEYNIIESLCRKSKGLNIPNMPTDEHEENLRILIFELLDPIRSIYGKNIKIKTGYLSKELIEATNEKMQ